MKKELLIVNSTIITTNLENTQAGLESIWGHISLIINYILNLVLERIRLHNNAQCAHDQMIRYACKANSN